MKLVETETILEHIKAMEFHHFFRGVRLNSTWAIHWIVNLLPCFIHPLNDYIFNLLISKVLKQFDLFQFFQFHIQ